ncbi:DNA-binding protein [Chitinibacter fontanus]|uniref:DNA-binding protein n=1 Tax=Chitinibacter fontanus TaxID=1737446 RepID=A0A7D5ZBA0_9NEIS|nr:DNA-binding protein [Chitinibacter fontanus]QLI80846.1 DNA-binding protein [Chitinibacter fontanus]
MPVDYTDKNNATLTTNEVALLLKVKAQTIRKNYCLKGSFLGCRPIKLSNGLLRWPTKAILNILEGL